MRHHRGRVIAEGQRLRGELRAHKRRRQPRHTHTPTQTQQRYTIRHSQRHGHSGKMGDGVNLTLTPSPSSSALLPSPPSSLPHLLVLCGTGWMSCACGCRLPFSSIDICRCCCVIIMPCRMLMAAMVAYGFIACHAPSVRSANRDEAKWIAFIQSITICPIHNHIYIYIYPLNYHM